MEPRVTEEDISMAVVLVVGRSWTVEFSTAVTEVRGADVGAGWTVVFGTAEV